MFTSLKIIGHPPPSGPPKSPPMKVTVNSELLGGFQVVSQRSLELCGVQLLAESKEVSIGQ